MYHVVEIDALDRHTILSTHKLRRSAYARVSELREAFGKSGLRYIVSKGGPYDHVRGWPTYSTLAKVANDIWEYRGHCFRAQSEMAA